MKRKPLVASIVLIIILMLLLLSPWICGVLIKRQINVAIAAFNNQNTPVNIELSQYNEGWLHSLAIIKVSADVADNQTTTIPLTFNITHGPIVNYNNFHFGIGKFSTQYSADPITLHLDGYVSFSGMLNGNASTNPIAYNVIPGTNINVSAITSNFSVNINRFDSFNINSLLSQLNSNSQGLGKLSVQNFSFAIQGQKLKDNSWDTTLSLNIGPTTVSSEIKGFSLNAGFDALNFDQWRFNSLLLQELSSIQDDNAQTADSDSAENVALNRIATHAISKQTQFNIKGFNINTHELSLNVDSSARWPQLPQNPSTEDLSRFLVQQIDLVMPKLVLGNETEGLKVQNLILHSNVQQESSKDSLSFDSLNANSLKFNVKANQFSLNNQSTFAQNLLNSDADLSLQQLCFDKECLKQTKAAWSLHNFNLSVFSAPSFDSNFELAWNKYIQDNDLSSLVLFADQATAKAVNNTSSINLSFNTHSDAGLVKSSFNCGWPNTVKGIFSSANCSLNNSMPAYYLEKIAQHGMNLADYDYPNPIFLSLSSRLANLLTQWQHNGYINTDHSVVDILVQFNNGEFSINKNVLDSFNNGYATLSTGLYALAYQHFASAHDNPLAEYYMGMQSVLGLGTPADTSKGLSLLQKAADQHITRAAIFLGGYYAEDLKTPGNYQKALNFIQTGLQEQDPNAQVVMGLLAAAGNAQAGVKPDYTAAVNWYKMAADQGLPLGQYYLGQAYENGQGVQKDLNQAYLLYMKAASGLPAASDAAYKLKKQMNK